MLNDKINTRSNSVWTYTCTSNTQHLTWFLSKFRGDESERSEQKDRHNCTERWGKRKLRVVKRPKCYLHLLEMVKRQIIDIDRSPDISSPSISFVAPPIGGASAHILGEVWGLHPSISLHAIFDTQNGIHDKQRVPACEVSVSGQ